MGIFKLVEETREQIIVQVTAKTAFTVAQHPYVDSTMEYITVTRGDDRIYTVIKENGTTWSWNRYSTVSDNTERLRSNLERFIFENNVFLDARTELNPYAAKFYLYEGLWRVNFYFADTRDEGHVMFSPTEYPTPESLVTDGFSQYNELFRHHKPIEEVPNDNVGVVYKVEIGE